MKRKKLTRKQKVQMSGEAPRESKYARKVRDQLARESQEASAERADRQRLYLKG